ncbi:MAG: EAL domain-containing protein (putative c-di-GMP-specific phosphodiesterase class I) [Gammaproteobacteria bacterium]|jgi:EAL domain-containing protein (putative c-di-GMP-specific phosphodiesterase class I)
MNAGLLNNRIDLSGFGSALRQQGARIQFNAGYQIFLEGDVGDVAYLVEDGYVEISNIGSQGKEVIALLGPGEIFGEMAPIEGQRRTSTATTMHAATVALITHEDLNSAVRSANPLVQLLLRSALNRLRETRHSETPQEAALDARRTESTADTYDAVRKRAAAQIQRRMELQEAVEANRLTVFYQPIVTLTDGRTVGYEALVRWPKPDGMVSPADFIPLAEESGLVVPLGQWVLETALGATRRMHRYAEQKQVRSEPVFISINVSPRQFEQRADLERLAKTIEEADVDPSHIKLEITEGMLLADPQAAAAALARLKSTGARIALDDFGVGYSSLSYLHRYPIDTLKIDRSFIMTLTKGEGGKRVVTGILSLAHALGMDVVAEGIEVLEEYLWLQDQGCQMGQGYLMGKPAAYTGALEHVVRGFEW